MTPLTGTAGYRNEHMGTPGAMTSTLRKTALALAAAALLAGCGDNTDVGRGETNCDGDVNANNTHDAACEETGNPGNVG